MPINQSLQQQQQPIIMTTSKAMIATTFTASEQSDESSCSTPMHSMASDETASSPNKESTILEEMTELIAVAASKQVKKFEEHSRLPRKPKHMQPLPLSFEQDVRVEQILGVGGFATVSLAQIPRLDQHIQKIQQEKTSSRSNRKRIQPTINSSSEEQQQQHTHAKYAVKCLSPKTMQGDRKRLIRSAQDLCVEAALLSKLNHENIIPMYGIVDGSYDEESTFRQPGSYFFVMPRMPQTLDVLLTSWEEQQQQQLPSSLVIPSLDQRLSQIALGIAKAMKYLHQQRVVYRDLKPANIGISDQGIVKVLDFGIARELPVWEHSITECIGSLRYMAPETLTERTADFASDVYSFSILLWQIVTCQSKPYGNMNLVKLVDFRDAVGYNDVRPGVSVSDNEPALKDHTAIAKLIENCWEGNPTKRPTFRQVVKVLEQNEQQRASSIAASVSNRATGTNTGTGSRFWNRLRQGRQHVVCST